MADKPGAETTHRSWRGTQTLPSDGCVQVIALGFTQWIYARFDDGRWRDANGTPVDVLAWRDASAGDDDA